MTPHSLSQAQRVLAALLQSVIKRGEGSLSRAALLPYEQYFSHVPLSTAHTQFATRTPVLGELGINLGKRPNAKAYRSALGVMDEASKRLTAPKVPEVAPRPWVTPARPGEQGLLFPSQIARRPNRI